MNQTLFDKLLYSLYTTFVFDLWKETTQHPPYTPFVFTPLIIDEINVYSISQPLWFLSDDEQVISLDFLSHAYTLSPNFDKIVKHAIIQSNHKLTFSFTNDWLLFSKSLVQNYKNLR